MHAKTLTFVPYARVELSKEEHRLLLIHAKAHPDEAMKHNLSLIHVLDPNGPIVLSLELIEVLITALEAKPLISTAEAANAATLRENLRQAATLMHANKPSPIELAGC